MSCSLQVASSQGACGAVFVFGLHNSGIYALVEYLHAFFDVEVQPPMRTKKRAGDGLLHWGARKLRYRDLAALELTSNN